MLLNFMLRLVGVAEKGVRAAGTRLYMIFLQVDQLRSLIKERNGLASLL